MNHISKYNIYFIGIILIIIFIFLLLIYNQSIFKINITESFDNLIPNKLRWYILRANNDDEMEKGCKECQKNCSKYGKSELGCLQSCVNIIKDREFYLRSYKYNMFDNE